MPKQVGRPRGRPKDEGKRDAILDAARSLLLARGLEVTTEEIAAQAGVAKATLYANFSDKDDLIEAVIRRESDRTVTDEDFERSRSGPAEVALAEYGKRYLHFINQRETLGWDRLISLAAARNPELPRRFFSAGPGRGQKMLTGIIDAAMERGELKKGDASAAADDLAGLWIGFTNLEIKLGARPPLSPAEINARALRGVQLFTLIYGTTNAD
ncbi:TetR/AcrR family transcriptional regulator [Phyllobacterium phragmitis]|uniref:TetR/AcrR family transcriptional regulator n=1 Tax=Phyllobacterium phragmitis TaxID=2670329 RepID=A0A2S9IRQ8_9HYPH|nr:TetR/AcrR family transcriptional regulator [Phyllobacterium phragmitis]PRD43211.1 TetR/AcrR family transcriptional regulator [Phyllobacterium phragmitis]